VAEDYELQDWIRDIGEEGIAWQDGNKRGVPDKLETVEQLVNEQSHNCSWLYFPFGCGKRKKKYRNALLNINS